MSTRCIWPRAALTLAFAVSIAVIVPAAASATKPTDLRVVNTQGKTLAEQRQYSGTTDVPTDPKAACFGAGTGGSGNAVTLSGVTALGGLVEASDANGDLRPVAVTDAFSFGLGVCGIGGFDASGSSFWLVKQNHAESQVGADQIKPAAGDELLWYLTPDFPAPPELALDAPASARPGEPFTVSVQQFGADGSGSPVTGATVSGAGSSATTDGSGSAQVTVGDSGQVTLQAAHGADIPSNQVAVCVKEGGCPAAPGLSIFGSSSRDKIEGTPGPDLIKARQGNDLVRARGGAKDRINCGAGRHNVAKVDLDDEVKRCQRVVRR